MDIGQTYGDHTREDLQHPQIVDQKADEHFSTWRHLHAHGEEEERVHHSFPRGL